MGIRDLTVFGDSQLVVRQISLYYKVRQLHLRPYWSKAVHLMGDFRMVTVDLSF
jgi:ribonuclease HI